MTAKRHKATQFDKNGLESNPRPLIVETVKRCQGKIRLGCTRNKNGVCYSCGRPMLGSEIKISGEKPIV